MSVKLFAASLAFDLKVSPHGLFYAPASILCSSDFNSLRQCSFARHHLLLTINVSPRSLLCSGLDIVLIWLQFLTPMSTCASDSRILRLSRTLNLVFTIFTNADFNLQSWFTSPSEISFHLLITHLVISLTSRSLSTFFIFFNLFFNSLMYFFSFCKIIYSIKFSPWHTKCAKCRGL